jgi:hypothetical protein
MKTVKVSDSNHERLMRIGYRKQTMDDVIGILLTEYEKRHKL